MQTNDPATTFSALDHYYTTDPKDMKYAGCRFEGIIGYLYPDKFGNTIALHHWHNAILHDNFYTHEPPNKTDAGDYVYQGVVGYIYRNPANGTVPLLRWWLDGEIADHFYCTDPRGEAAPALGFVFEGITGYIFPDPVEGTIPLFRWFHPQ
ncbi:hypothetical protein BGX26_009277 [Mortierella sp. AD094]|nr:hypothetical protein BGX26_009277 [Mortierella sp. AD094]